MPANALRPVELADPTSSHPETHRAILPALGEVKPLAGRRMLRLDTGEPLSHTDSLPEGEPESTNSCIDRFSRLERTVQIPADHIRPGGLLIAVNYMFVSSLWQHLEETSQTFRFYLELDDGSIVDVVSTSHAESPGIPFHGFRFDGWQEVGRSSWRSGMALLEPDQLHGDVTLVFEVQDSTWCEGRTGVLIDDLRVFAPFN